MKISFLIPAHNEEKIIEKPLKALERLPYKNYEVIIGLDGCTDNTENIVKEYCKKNKNFRYYSLNTRSGKPAVINYLVKKSRGSIIIIHDADWIFKYNNAKTLNKFISVFKDKKMGGIAESFPVEWNNHFDDGNWVFKMVAYSSYYWLMFQKDKLTTQKDELSFLNEPTMFMTNFFKKELYKDNTSLGDDFERTKDIMEKGYEVVLFSDKNMPRMISSYNKIKLLDFLKQKIRTAMARKQLKDKKYLGRGAFWYYSHSIPYMLRKSFKDSIKRFFLVSIWIIITSIAAIYSSFKKESTKNGWMLRAKR